MSSTLHAWYSNKMFINTQTLYVYTNNTNKRIESTCISDSNTVPFKNPHTSIYNDFLYLGPVTSYISTIVPPNTKYNTKKIYYPKPLAY